MGERDRKRIIRLFVDGQNKVKLKKLTKVAGYICDLGMERVAEAISLLVGKVGYYWVAFWAI